MNISAHHYQTRLLLLQPTPFCNMDCRYCYLPDRNQNVRMPPHIPKLALNFLHISRCLGSRLDISWHAGEPLILPVEYYEEVFDGIESIKPQNLHIKHLFQTNGTLINDEFCRFLKKRKAGIGVSIDGSEAIHNKNRPFRSGKGTYNLVMQGIEKLKSHNIPFSIMAVLTRESLNFPETLFDFFASNGFERLCFNLEEVVGINKKTAWDEDNVSAAVKRFFIRYIELLRSGQVRQWVREIDGRLEMLFNGHLSEVGQNEPFRIVSVNWEGEVSTFSPEFLDIDYPRFGKIFFGNVNSIRLEKLLENKKFQLVNAEIQEGVAACRKTCSYFKVCGGGAPAKKLAENGTFSSTETTACRLGIQAITDVLLDLVENAASQTIN